MAEINLCAEPRTNMTKIVHDYSQSRNPTVYCELSTRLDVETSRKQFSRESKFLAFWQAFITILQPVNSFEWRCYVVHLNSSVDCYSSQFNQARERERERKRERGTFDRTRTTTWKHVTLRWRSARYVFWVNAVERQTRATTGQNTWVTFFALFTFIFSFAFFFSFLSLPPALLGQRRQLSHAFLWNRTSDENVVQAFNWH